MTYRAGTLGLSPIGIPDDTPRIVCDGCGLVYRIAVDRLPPKWFLDGKSPRGWLRDVDGHGVRHDACPACARKGPEL